MKTNQAILDDLESMLAKFAKENDFSSDEMVALLSIKINLISLSNGYTEYQHELLLKRIKDMFKVLKDKEKNGN